MVFKILEPAVGFGPTTYGLQNRCSTTELRWLKRWRTSRAKVVGRVGFEPTKAGANRFTVCPV